MKEQVEAVQRMQDYIQEHLKEAVTLADLSRVDGYQRAFFREFGCNPREYAWNPVPLYLFTPHVSGRTVRGGRLLCGDRGGADRD